MPRDFGATPGKRAEIPALTGLRGIAALLVAVYHINPELFADGAIGRVVKHGYLWVDLFFVLSGFILALTYADRFSAGWAGDRWIEFLLRRLARIYPLYFVMLSVSLFYMTLSTTLPGAPAVIDWLLPTTASHHPIMLGTANLFLVQSWSIGYSFDGTGWSLSVEWAAYVAFPLLVGLALFRGRRMAVALAVAAVAGLVAILFLTSTDGVYHSGPLDAWDGRTIEPLIRGLSGFGIGILTFRLTRSEQLVAWMRRDSVTALVTALLAVGFAFGPDVMIYSLFPVLVFCLYANRGWMARMFGCRAIYWLGTISYSIYLVHPYFVLLKRRFAEWLGAAMPMAAADLVASLPTYVVVLVLAALAYHFIEQPGRHRLNRVARAWRERAVRISVPSTARS
jgi:peptidoglycan/LPS O-acetylase OafA/YrhL